jgi:hypothetical protein
MPTTIRQVDPETLETVDVIETESKVAQALQTHIFAMIGEADPVSGAYLGIPSSRLFYKEVSVKKAGQRSKQSMSGGRDDAGVRFNNAVLS